MFVFLLAGAEVVLSALVLAVCNLLCIQKTPPEADAAVEAGKVAGELEQLRENRAEEPKEPIGGADTLMDLEDLETEGVTQEASMPQNGHVQNGGVLADPEINL